MSTAGATQLGRRGPARTRGWWWLPALTVPVLALGTAAPLAGLMALCAGLTAVATAAIAHGIRRHRPARPLAWWLLAVTAGCGTAAAAAWFVELVVLPPEVLRFTAVDVLYFTVFPPLLAALALLPERRGDTSRWAGLTEAGIVVCTGVVLAWVLLYDPYVHDLDVSVPVPAAGAYPFLDAVLIGMAVRLIVVQSRLTAAHLLVLIGTAVLTAADIRYFLSVMPNDVSTWPGFSAAGWTVAFVLFGAASLYPSAALWAPTDHAPPAAWRTGLVHVALVLIGPAATAYALLRDHGTEDLDPADIGLPVALTAVTAVLLVVRMTTATRLAQRHAATLHRTLDEQAVLQESMRHMALHDALTGLPNRNLLAEELRRVESGRDGALLLLDLDGFKDVNDRLGHSIGDQLLTSIADRLRELVGPGEMLARPGGDEFAVLLPGTADAAGRADAILAAVRRPVEVSGHTLHVTGSIGIRTLSAHAHAGATALLGDADLALYAAKEAGKDCFVLFDAGLRHDQAERIRMVERLRAGLAADEFTVHYQPIVALDGGAPVAVEALVRWEPPGQPMVGPDRFVPAAEDSGLIVGLGEWVLRRACADAAGWHRRHGTTLTVNVSPRQLTDPEFTAKVRRALDDSGLPARVLTLEITEGVLVRSGAHSEQALSHLSALRAEGVRVAIDDFGTGYSSLAYLRDLPIDTLKIDRSFMPADCADAQQVALVRAIVDLARGLGLTTVAEGVETVHHAELLRELGCDRAQGYLFARPQPAAAVTARLAAEFGVPIG